MGVTAAVFPGDQSPTYIYRMGSGNATNLTPRVVDTNGLSYMLDRPTLGPYTVTTMQKVNAIEVLSVVVDGPRYVSVMATSNQMLADWIESRSTALDNPHLLTTILQGISIKVK